MNIPTWVIIQKRIDQPQVFGEYSEGATNDIRDLLDALYYCNTRLQLARALIAVLSHNGMMPENMMTDNGEAWRKWQAEEMTK